MFRRQLTSRCNVARKMRSKEIHALYKNIDNEILPVSLRLRTIIAFRQHLEEWQSLFAGLHSFKDVSECFREMHAHVNQCEEIIARCVRDDYVGMTDMDVQLSEYICELPHTSFFGLSSIKAVDNDFNDFHGEVEELLRRLLDDLEESSRRFGHIMSGSRDEGDLDLHKPFRSKKSMPE